jgi:acetyl esterase/lipase
MGEHAVSRPASPIPAQPSVESVRLLRKRRRGKRGGMDTYRPSGIKLATARAMIHLIAAVNPLPRTVSTQRERYGESRLGRWVTAKGAETARGALLYLHGGGFVWPSVHAHAAAAFSELVGIPAFLPTYRLAPEHPFPAAADDVLAAHKHLLDKGIPADRIRVAGDSSGGFLATALLGDLQRSGLPLPAAVLLMSPLVDLSAASAKHCDQISRDPSTSPHFIEVTNKAYTTDTPLTNPRLDVLGADKRNWPPILIQTGDTECLTAENQRLADSIRAAGGICELQIWPGQIHAFPIVGGNKIPEADAARRYAAWFLTAPAWNTTEQTS